MESSHISKQIEIRIYFSFSIWNWSLKMGRYYIISCKLSQFSFFNWYICSWKQTTPSLFCLFFFFTHFLSFKFSYWSWFIIIFWKCLHIFLTLYLTAADNLFIHLFWKYSRVSFLIESEFIHFKMWTKITYRLKLRIFWYMFLKPKYHPKYKILCSYATEN